MRVATLLVGAAMAMLAAAPAQAYRYRTCEGQPLRMPGSEIVVRSSTSSFPPGQWADGLQNAINQFNDHPSNLFYTRINDDGVVGLNNGQNEVWGSTDPNILQGAPAIAYSRWDCFRTPTGLVARMTESDVIFDYGNTRWTTVRQKSQLFTYTGSALLDLTSHAAYRVYSLNEPSDSLSRKAAIALCRSSSASKSIALSAFSNSSSDSSGTKTPVSAGGEAEAVDMVLKSADFDDCPPGCRPPSDRPAWTCPPNWRNRPPRSSAISAA